MITNTSGIHVVSRGSKDKSIPVLRPSSASFIHRHGGQLKSERRFFRYLYTLYKLSSMLRRQILTGLRYCTH